MALKLYDWDLRNKAKISTKVTIKQPVLDFLHYLKNSLNTIQTKFSTVILYHSSVLFVQWNQNRMGGMEKHSQNQPINGQFQTFLGVRKTCPNDSIETYGPACASASNSYDWDSSESERKELSRLHYRTCDSGLLRTKHGL